MTTTNPEFPFRLPDAEFKKWAEEQNALYRQRMQDAGYLYWPEIDRWFPAGTEIVGLSPEPQGT